jgi:hypothetical protein
MDTTTSLGNESRLPMSESTFDEMTGAIDECSDALSPDSSKSPRCMRDDCRCCQAWIAVNSKLEEKLNLFTKVCFWCFCQFQVLMNVII